MDRSLNQCRSYLQFLMQTCPAFRQIWTNVLRDFPTVTPMHTAPTLTARLTALAILVILEMERRASVCFVVIVELKSAFSVVYINTYLRKKFVDMTEKHPSSELLKK